MTLQAIKMAILGLILTGTINTATMVKRIDCTQYGIQFTFQDDTGYFIERGGNND